MVPCRLVLLLVAAGSLAAQTLDCGKERAQLQTRFGAQVEFVKGQQPCAVTGDFNRDGKLDIAMLARVQQLGQPADGASTTQVAVANPWKPGQSVPPNKGALVLAAVFEGQPPKLFLLADAEFFASPMWSHPVKLLSRVAGPKGGADRIAVATEGGPDLQLYWTGSRWRLEVSKEAP